MSSTPSVNSSSCENLSAAKLPTPGPMPPPRPPKLEEFGIDLAGYVAAWKLFTAQLGGANLNDDQLNTCLSEVLWEYKKAMAMISQS